MKRLNLSKVKSCEQDWSKMLPADGGRICEACEKKIIDFRKKSKKDIAIAHLKSDTAVCGLYSDEQLSQLPEPEFNHQKAGIAPILTIMGVLTLNPLVAQVQTKENPAVVLPENSSDTLNLTDSLIQREEVDVNRVYIKGRVVEKTSEGDFNPIPFAGLMIEGTDIICTSDVDGYYEMDLSSLPDTVSEVNLIFSYVGYERIVRTVKIDSASIQNFEVTEANQQLVAFGVKMEDPPKKWRPFGRLKSLFRNKNH